VQPWPFTHPTKGETEVWLALPANGRDIGEAIPTIREMAEEVLVCVCHADGRRTFYGPPELLQLVDQAAEEHKRHLPIIKGDSDL